MRAGSWSLIRPTSFIDSRGTLSVMELEAELQFKAERVFWISDVPRGSLRGQHAHFSGRQVLVCLSGSVLARVNNGIEEAEFLLKPGSAGLAMGEMVWGEQRFLSEGSTLVTFASNRFFESDYIRDFEEFLALARQSS